VAEAWRNGSGTHDFYDHQTDPSEMVLIAALFPAGRFFSDKFWRFERSFRFPLRHGPGKQPDYSVVIPTQGEIMERIFQNWFKKKPGTIHNTSKDARTRLGLTALESREVPATVVDGVLMIDGTAGHDSVTVYSLWVGRNSSTGVELYPAIGVLQGGITQLIDLSLITQNQVEFRAYTGDDLFDNKSLELSAFADGGDGNDTLFGGRFNDTLIGGTGNDTLAGRQGDDTSSGMEGNDFLFEFGFGDLALGSGNDKLDGGSGDDTITAGDGSDFVDGGQGADRIDGGRGDDELNGGDGDD
jgi:hypothetical protein